MKGGGGRGREERGKEESGRGKEKEEGGRIRTTPMAQMLLNLLDD